jgi:hemerythrin
MPRIDWTEQMSVGVPEIDRQHQRLIELFNNLEDGLVRGSASRNVRGLFAELSSYTKYHFSTEVNMLRVEQYAGLDSHLAAHDDFVAKVEALGPMVQRDGIDQAAVEANRFLRGWILKHIVVVDRLAFKNRRKRLGGAAATPGAESAVAAPVAGAAESASGETTDASAGAAPEAGAASLDAPSSSAGAPAATVVDSPAASTETMDATASTTAVDSK